MYLHFGARTLSGTENWRLRIMERKLKANNKSKLSDVDIEQVTATEFVKFMDKIRQKYPTFFECMFASHIKPAGSILCEEGEIDIKKVRSDNNPCVPYIIEVYDYPSNDCLEPDDMHKQWCAIYNAMNDDDPVTFNTYAAVCVYVQDELIQLFPTNEVRIIKEYPFSVKVGRYEEVN